MKSQFLPIGKLLLGSRYLFLLLFAGTFSANAQDNTVSGTVTSSDGGTLPGVNVLVKGGKVCPTP